MDKMRSRRPTLKPQQSSLREDFKPEFHWTDDVPSTHTLLVLLPGFRREDLKVQVENAGKLLVKGSQQAADGKVLVVDQSFDIPRDTIVEKITGTFSDGKLTLFMPRREVLKEKESLQEGTAEEKPRGEAETKDEPTKEEEKTTEEKGKSEAEQKDEPKEEEKTAEEKPKSETEKKGEPKDEEKTTEEKPKSETEKKDEPKEEGKTSEEAPKRAEDDKVGETQLEKPESKAEKKDESIRREEVIDGVKKMKAKVMEVFSDKTKEIRNKIASFKGLDSGTVDGILEKMNRNRNMIAAVVVGLSVGIYVSHKLRTRCK